jgi:hypothetical protein
MQIFRHFTANDVQLEAFPFKRELSMEAYLVENEGVLSLDCDTFSNVEIIETELALKQGRKSKDTDGRIDILATYSQEYIAIVELKLGQLERSHLEQLEDYLSTGRDQILLQYPDILDKDLIASPKWIGVLIGSSIEAELASQLVNGYSTTSGVQIAALTIQRFRSKEGNVYVTTDTYFGGKASSKDTSKYIFNGIKLGKGRLVLDVIKQYIATNQDTTYAELEKIFPKNCQGSRGVFSTTEIANEKYSTSGRKRHFLEPQELIKLSDCTIAVSSQWGIKNIGKFIKRAKEVGFTIKEANG